MTFSTHVSVLSLITSVVVSHPHQYIPIKIKKNFINLKEVCVPELAPNVQQHENKNRKLTDIFFQPSLHRSHRLSPSLSVFSFSVSYLSVARPPAVPPPPAPAARSSFIPLLTVCITLRNVAVRQPRVFPLLLLDKGLSAMPLGPLGKPELSIPSRCFIIPGSGCPSQMM